MAAKILYTAKGTDLAMITWPQVGPPNERFKFTSGQSLIINDLIGYGDGTITYPDGRIFPPITAQGSTLIHQKG